MSDKSVSARTLAILERYLARDVKIVIATARPPRSALPGVLNNICNHIVCYNGAEIYNKTSLLHKQHIPATIVKRIVDGFHKLDSKIQIALEIDDQLFANYDISINGWVPPYSQVDFCYFNYRSTAKVLVNFQSRETVPSFRETLPDECVMVVTDDDSLGQIMHKGVSKANAAIYFLQMYGYGPEDVIAFGDDYNDVDLLTRCGIGVAMGNARSEIKEVADIIAPSNDDDGVAYVLEKLAAQKL